MDLRSTKACAKCTKGSGLVLHFVHFASFAVEKPAPFVEIAAQVLDVYAEHMAVLIRGTRVRMHDGPFGVIEREPVTMDSTREVDVLWVHEIALVKQPRLHSRFCA